MRQGLGEDHGVAGLAVYFEHVLLVLFPPNHALRTGEVGLVAARYHRHAPVARPFVSQQILDHGQPGVDAVVLKEIRLRYIPALDPAAVQKPALATRVHGDQPRPVVEAIPPAQNLFEIGLDLGMDQQLAERLAIGTLPSEHAA